MCSAVKSTCSGHSLHEKANFFFAFVKVAVAMQNIHQFASNLTPLLMCLRLTLICYEDVPLIRNSLNSQPQIALAEHGRIPGDATSRSYNMSTPTVCKGKSYLLLHTLRKQTRKWAQEVVLLSSRLFTLTRSGEPDMHIDDGDDSVGSAPEQVVINAGRKTN